MKPKLTPKTPRLSLAGQWRDPHPAKCQLCGKLSMAHDFTDLVRWQEHDHLDQPEQIVIVLCKECSKREIRDHPRLYRELDPFAPWAGCMPICWDCENRDGVSCRMAKHSGGPGVAIAMPEKVRGFICMRPGGCRPFERYGGPAESCSGKTPRPAKE